MLAVVARFVIGFVVVALLQLGYVPRARAALAVAPSSASLLGGRQLAPPVLLGLDTPAGFALRRLGWMGSGGEQVANRTSRALGWIGVGGGVAVGVVGVALFQGALGPDPNPMLGGGLVGAGVLAVVAGAVLLSGASSVGNANGALVDNERRRSPLPAREAVAGFERSRAFDRGRNVPMLSLRW